MTWGAGGERVRFGEGPEATRHHAFGVGPHFHRSLESINISLSAFSLVAYGESIPSLIIFQWKKSVTKEEGEHAAALKLRTGITGKESHSPQHPQAPEGEASACYNSS